MSKDKTMPRPGVDMDKKIIRFDYLKSPLYRTIYINGIFGGISPRGQLVMTAWKERWPIPKQVTHTLNEDGNLGNEILPERVSRDAVIREVEVGLQMDIDTAKSVRDWLTKKIKAHEKKLKEIEEQAKETG